MWCVCSAVTCAEQLRKQWQRSMLPWTMLPPARLMRPSACVSLRVLSVAGVLCGVAPPMIFVVAEALC